MRIATAEYTISFQWNFSTDGNTIGTYQTGIELPPNSVINRFVIASLETLVSPGATITVNCGSTLLLAFAANIATGLIGGSTDPFIILIPNSIQYVTFDITVTNVTSGIMKGWIQYFPS